MSGVETSEQVAEQLDELALGRGMQAGMTVGQFSAILWYVILP